MSIEVFEREAGYVFKDPGLLETALVHRSYVNLPEHAAERTNERLEFLGDAFLDAIVGEELMRRMDSAPEGVLSKTRALIVCESALADVGKKLGIGQCLKLGPGEESTGGREKPSIVADAMEALIGAIYLDGGYEAARAFVVRNFDGVIEQSIKAGAHAFGDYKSALQEYLQQNGDVSIEYRLEGEEGPDHDKTFHMSVWCDGRELGKGSGRSKKAAAQMAAHEALKVLGADK